MCGLFGILYRRVGLVPDEGRLQRSAQALAHRGPDACAVLAEPGLGLAHARLSLVDVAPRSDQPFHDEGGRHVLVFNGEIYNFRQLRAELEGRGVRFRTTSDTEVVLHSLILDGPAALARFEGMFALALIDRQEGSVLLARDRFGMKPLFWAELPEGGGALLFGSEVPAFGPWMELRPDQGALFAYLMKFGGPTAGRSFYEGIRSLAPGSFLVWGRGRETVGKSFFRLEEFLDADEAEALRGLPAGAVADRFDEIMQEAVASHLFADARVGAFASGGVDSSLIVAMAARQQKDVALFHANVKGAWSETPAARGLAEHLGLELHVAEVEEQDFVDMIPRVMRHYGYPFSYHPNCAPLMLTAELARERGVKGLLSGEGSDELFLGYPWLGRKPLTDAFAAAAGAARGALRRLPAIGQLLAPVHEDNALQVRDLMNGREMADDMAAVEAALAAFPAALQDAGTRWTLDYMHHHLRTLLHRNDTMGMAGSIEARFPFLDHRLVRFGVNLPRRFKLRLSPFVLEKAHPFVRDKWVVRAVADRYVPRHLSRRIKIGFWTTVFQRLDIAPAGLAGSPLCDVLRLGQAQLERSLAEAAPDLRLRLLLADVWLRVMVARESEDGIRARLRDHVTILPEGQRPPQPARRGRAAIASAPV